MIEEEVRNRIIQQTGKNIFNVYPDDIRQRGVHRRAMTNIYRADVSRKIRQVSFGLKIFLFVYVMQ